MEIIVCIRRAPKTDARIKPNADGTSYDVAGVNYDISEYDRYAIEAAVELAEKNSGNVTVVSVGPSAATKEVRVAIAMGCKVAHLIVSDTEHDSFATASALYNKIKDMPHDLVFFGWNSVDNQGSATGQMFAELAGVASVSVAAGLEVADGVAKVERLAAGGQIERYEVKLPAVITCNKGLNKPRSANMKGIMMAKKTKVEETPVDAPANGVSVIKFSPPAPRPEGRIVGTGAEAVADLVKALQDEAKVI
ncbi:MAG: electron transfer flavoprotein subunit beta/FixA family protein [Planctomycetes bacterium]|nr:electron transfer flavoprotein subunit beta/FixA family protein [Planctomycetota bacterium]